MALHNLRYLLPQKDMPIIQRFVVMIMTKKPVVIIDLELDFLQKVGELMGM